MQGNCRESWGECKNTLLKPRIVQGNCMETGGKLKNTFFAKKSAQKLQGNWGKLKKLFLSPRKLGGNSKIHFLPRKVHRNCRETQGKLKKMYRCKKELNFINIWIFTYLIGYFYSVSLIFCQMSAKFLAKYLVCKLFFDLMTGLINFLKKIECDDQ